MLDTQKLIVVGDRVLIRPTKETDKSRGGLYLPPSVVEKELVQSGYVIRTGPGYPVPVTADDDEPWKEGKKTNYIPLQANEGDLALYLKKDAVEIELHKEKLVIVPQSAILLLIRDDELSI